MTRKSRLDRFLDAIERGGNALPHPATLFALLALLVVIASWFASLAGLAVQHPTTGATVAAVNLLSLAGLHRILTSLVANFTGFAPLGTVLVAMIGIGVAEHSGLMSAALRKLVLASPRRLLTPIVVFAGVMSNMASEIGYVLLIPLAGLIFKSAGRHPIVGMAAAFAGVSGGYSANLLIGTIDPLLSGLSQEAARIVDPTYTVSPLANWYFMAFSTPLITLLGWFVAERFTAPRFPDDRPVADTGGTDLDGEVTPAERRGLRYAGWATLALTLLLVLSMLPSGSVPGAGFLRNPADGDLLDSPLLSGVVAIIFLFGVVSGLAYGIGAGTFRSDDDVVKGMSSSMSTLGSYLVLVFFAAQFVAFFNWTQLGLIFAVNGAEGLKSLGLSAVPLFALFILLTASINLLMGSASAKWALMAPVFVPMFMLLGYSPELTQTAYRVGDSVTNIISPMMSYFALIIAFFQKYEPRTGLGTIVAVMLPYSATFLIGWATVFGIWLALGLPIGPDSPLQYPSSVDR
ncbi:MAG: AbgT family transporter [Gammaproteobacteria bacterium]|nr:AbgT family transporter [Gammaproteobacteria bacterium]